MTKIAVYAGHGGSDFGAVSNGLYEKDFNLEVLTYLTSVSYAGYLIRFIGYSFMLYSFTKLYKYNRLLVNLGRLYTLCIYLRTLCAHAGILGKESIYKGIFDSLISLHNAIFNSLITLYHTVLNSLVALDHASLDSLLATDKEILFLVVHIILLKFVSCFACTHGSCACE